MNFSQTNLSPELKLIICCAQTRMDSANAERIQSLIHAGLEWPKVIQLAFSHRVTPLLYNSLNSCCLEILPEPISVQLQNLYFSNLQSNLYITQELLSIIELFTVNKIQVIPYKGSVLAESIYGNLGLRHFNDLDYCSQT